MSAEEWIANLAAERDRRADAYPVLVAALKRANKLLWQEGFTTAEPVVAEIELALKEAGELE